MKEHSSKMTTTPTCSTAILTPREAILFSAKLLNKGEISVRGTTVVVDAELGRVDIALGGAKLIVRLPASAKFPEMGTEITVQGVLKKEQRRTFLVASSFATEE